MGYKKVVSADTAAKCTQQTVSRNPLFRSNRKMHSADVRMEWEGILESSGVVWRSIRVLGRMLGRHSGVVWGH